MSNDNILVSVIVPVWNAEQYLRYCVESIRRQTHKNLEIILVDDGSSDNCPVICDAYMLEDSRIRVIHKENGGPASARNAGLDTMIGEWVCFIDSDDYVNERFVEILLKTAINCSAISARCKRVFTNQWEESVIQPAETVISMQWFDYVIYLDNTPGYTIHSVCWGIYQACVFSNLRFPDINHSEDTLVSTQIYWNYRNSKFGITNQTLYYYYQSEKSITRGVKSLRRLDRYSSLKWCMDFWEQKGEHEICNCYFKTYFTQLIKDYTEMRRDLPKLRTEYEHLANEITDNLPKAFDMNLKVVRIALNAPATFEMLRQNRQKLILFGLNNYCTEIYDWLRYYNIDVFQVWDDKVTGQFGNIAVGLPNDGLTEKENVLIAFTVDNETTQAHLSRELRCMGYNKFLSCDSIYGTIKYARYNEFLPELLRGLRCC